MLPHSQKKNSNAVFGSMGCLLINFWIIFLLGDNMMMTFQPENVSGKPVYICWLASLARNC